MKKKESYIVIDGVRYDAVKREDNITGMCNGCCFFAGDDCTMPDTNGFSIDCDGDYTFVSRGEVAAQQRLTERNEKDLYQDNPIAIASDKVKIVGQGSQEPDEKVARLGAIGKRRYYPFPNGVEAEDICRYLPFNLGNVVKYVCRAGQIDGYTKIEDLKKAKDYLDNEIERLKEEFGNEIQGMKDKIAKQKERDD